MPQKRSEKTVNLPTFKCNLNVDGAIIIGTQDELRGAVCSVKCEYYACKSIL
ncbi:MAG: hypothetical protein ACI875_001122 [Planctomycetota bacterium]|jgi:hypothetical protein